MRRITLDDVANLAGVSPITVSRVLRKPGAVSEGLRLRVHAAVNELGYVPNVAASRLASSRTHAIGVIVPTLYNVIFAEYLFALHEVLVDAGFQVSSSTAAIPRSRRKTRSRRYWDKRSRRSSSPVFTIRRFPGNFSLTQTCRSSKPSNFPTTR